MSCQGCRFQPHLGVCSVLNLRRQTLELVGAFPTEFLFPAGAGAAPELWEWCLYHCGTHRATSGTPWAVPAELSALLGDVGGSPGQLQQVGASGSSRDGLGDGVWGTKTPKLSCGGQGEPGQRQLLCPHLSALCL